MKKKLFIWTLCFFCSIAVFSQSKKSWEETQSANSIEAYQAFIAKYPRGKYLDEAKLKLAQLEFKKAKQENTVAAYEDFIEKTSDTELINEANSQIARIREEEADYDKIKETKSIDEIISFQAKYPNSRFKPETNRQLEELRLENALSDGSSKALNDFILRYPNSQYARQVKEKIPPALLAEAVAKGTDEALIAFIKTNNDALLIEDAIARLKSFMVIDIGKTILWESLPTVFCGGVESGGVKYECGIDFRAFKPGINEDSWRSAMVGPMRFYEPDVAELIFFNWTEFDGYCVRATTLNHETSDKKSFYTTAKVKRDGLLFEPNSIVLKKVKQ